MKRLLCIIFSTILLLLSCAKDEQVAYYPVDQEFVLRNIAYGTQPQQRMDVYLPAKRSIENTKIIVYLHGGQWSSGDKDDLSVDENLAAMLRDHFPGYAFFNVNYALAADSLAGSAAQAEADLLQAMDYIYDHAADYQVSRETYMAGFDAGAQLAALYTAKSSGVSPQLKGCMAISGVYDLQKLYQQGVSTTRGMLTRYLGASPKRTSSDFLHISPIHFITPKTAKFLIVHDKDNRIFPMQQALDFADHLRHQQVDCQLFTYEGSFEAIADESAQEVFKKIQLFLE